MERPPCWPRSASFAPRSSCFRAGSTAALALIFSPAWIAALGLPVGALAGFLLGRLWRTGQVVARGFAAALGALALALVVLGLARPELFPTAVLRRRQILERLGPPRVATGGERFDGVFVSERSAWHLAADLDGQPGDEIAVGGHESADILDGSSLARLSRVELGGNGRLRDRRVGGGGAHAQLELLQHRHERGVRLAVAQSQPPAGVASFTTPFNLSWHPAATVRAGLSRRGLPVGLQIVGPRHRDDLVLRAALAFQRERPWHPEWPTLAAT